MEMMIRTLSSEGSIICATVTASSGIEFALLGLVARSLNAPISTMAGGDSTRSFASTPTAMGVRLTSRLPEASMLICAIEKQPVSIVSPDIPRLVGLLEAKKGAGTCDTCCMPVAPHTVVSPIGIVTSAHVCAAMNYFPCTEYHAHDVAWLDDFVEGEPVIQSGFIHLSGAPGHGMTLNEDVASAHLKKGYSFFGDSPPNRGSVRHPEPAKVCSR